MISADCCDDDDALPVVGSTRLAKAAEVAGTEPAADDNLPSSDKWSSKSNTS